MLVQGQPETASEYIQATSRVGRQVDKPGLVVAVLNVHKPRDRAHHESFWAYHNAFYRAVEATSVTPWAARAMDRALAAVLVAITRHLEPHLALERAVVELGLDPALQGRVRQEILRRAPAANHAEVLAAVDGLLLAWQHVADDQTANGFPFHYGQGQQRLMHQPLDVVLRGLSPEHRRFTAGQSSAICRGILTSEDLRPILSALGGALMADVLRLSQLLGYSAPAPWLIYRIDPSLWVD